MKMKLGLLSVLLLLAIVLISGCGLDSNKGSGHPIPIVFEIAE